MFRRVLFAACVTGMLVLSSCADPSASSPSSSTTTNAQVDQKFPDVLRAELMRVDDTSYSITVTISSPYDTPDRYADGWRVLTESGEVLAEHELTHDHANEQPFTRTRGPFQIPSDVARVVVEGRDQIHGYGGTTATIDVP